MSRVVLVVGELHGVREESVTLVTAALARPRMRQHYERVDLVDTTRFSMAFRPLGPCRILRARPGCHTAIDVEAIYCNPAATKRAPTVAELFCQRNRRGYHLCDHPLRFTQRTERLTQRDQQITPICRVRRIDKLLDLKRALQVPHRLAEGEHRTGLLRRQL